MSVIPAFEYLVPIEFLLTVSREIYMEKYTDVAFITGRKEVKERVRERTVTETEDQLWKRINEKAASLKAEIYQVDILRFRGSCDKVMGWSDAQNHQDYYNRVIGWRIFLRRPLVVQSSPVASSPVVSAVQPG